ncbi:immunity protein YezG family protein [Macrococcus armenti]|uniref:immunity protein YezG family protein n=1 Tax=Macrococcus armenti TaxID=2875764 RepID=UPI001CC9A300|nr:immunity protein YezG family protein [Macrococcus armenti]UBH14800.1 antitoxin YezG family protein [Macrococcus armenti]UBH17159.1 antitoxin YezG family protein [Macrococcus armenti]UBH19425.1 antitoxin YezG family protein [Macrococcus armenti]
MDQKIKDKILEIIHQANDMIPEEWDELYINGDINGDEGGIFFYYRINNEWIYSHDIYEIFEGYSIKDYKKDWSELFKLGVELQKIFRDNNQPVWSKVILHVDEHMKLTTEFDYANWIMSKFNTYQYMDYFRHEYLKLPLKHVDEAFFEEMKEFKEIENKKLR